MQLILVDKDSLPYFECLLPVEFKYAAAIPGVILIGVADESPEDGAELPVGVMVLSFIHDDELRILWAFVDPESRGYGFGEAMLEKAFEIALADGRSKVTARIWGEDDEEGGEYHGDSWLGLHNFMLSVDKSPEWFVSINELPKAKGYGWFHEKDDDNVKPLRSVSATIRKKLLSTLIDDADYSWYSDIPLSSDLVDPDFSFVYMKGNKCIAAMIIERIGNTFYPVAMMQDCDVNVFRNFVASVLHKLEAVKTGFLRLAPHDDAAMKLTQLALDGIEPYNYRLFSAPATAIQDRDRDAEDQKERIRRDTELDALLPDHFDVIRTDYYSGVEV